ncbi:flagellar motor protein MotB [uncultured Tyzzerella sp.]|uniref:flagellar motor protein MotB n=1 Tax=uncultured Tyzzerella sp. TaxID=2321398 RepID=UPI002943A462|nr:flagellar motor protein MotB [uncultured Tyzzerella sp.]
MAKKEKKIEIKQGLAEWMGTYGDMVTLLLCFFVLMFASSSVDAEKFKQIASSFSNNKISVMTTSSTSILEALGNGIISMPKVEGNSDKEFENKGKEEMDNMAENFKTYFAENDLQDKIEVEKNDRYITLNFKDGILFESGSSDLKEEAKDILSKVADELLKYPDNHIKIEGHTDNMPINTPRFPNNWYLSAARSISVATYFTNNKGFSPDRISTEGYGEYKPKAPNDTSENRAINRRVEIKVISKYYNNEL